MADAESIDCIGDTSLIADTCQNAHKQMEIPVKGKITIATLVGVLLVSMTFTPAQAKTIKINSTCTMTGYKTSTFTRATTNCREAQASTQYRNTRGDIRYLFAKWGKRSETARAASTMKSGSYMRHASKHTLWRSF